jgi:hypothetical protein
VASPSRYFSNSHPNRDFPTPAAPITLTSRAERRSTQAWNNSLTSRSSASRPTSGASNPSIRCEPPTPDTTHCARHRGVGSALPFSTCSPAEVNATASWAARQVPASTSTEPGAAAPCTRAAVLTGSPATMPCPTAPTVTATSPVTTPARAASAARTARSASPSSAVGAPHTAITASPMNFSTVPPYRPITVRAESK